MLDNIVAGKVLIATLNSWRHLAGLSLFGMLFSLMLFLFGDSVTLLFLLSLSFGILCQYFCWRLWLDCRLFGILYQSPTESHSFDTAINMLWNKNGDNTRSLTSRWIGARGQLRFGGIALFVQWLIIILSVAVSRF